MARENFPEIPIDFVSGEYNWTRGYYTKSFYYFWKQKFYLSLSPISIRIPVAFYILIFNKLKLFIPHFIHLYRTFVLKYQ